MMQRSNRSGGVVKCAGLSLIATIAVSVGCNKVTDENTVDRSQISVTEVRRLLAEAQRKSQDDLIILVDPRSERDYNEAHIPSAKHLMLSDVMPGDKRDRSLSRHRHIVVYGEDPGSATARGMTKRLIGNGYDDVYLLDGGLDAWVRQGGEVVRAPQTAGVAPADATPSDR